MSKAKLTPEQLTEALDTLGKWFPEETPKLAKYRKDIVRHIVQGTEPAPDSPLASMQHETTPEAAIMLAATIPGVTPCQEACGIVAVDVVFFVFGLVGLHTSNQERIARAVIQELGGETLRGLARAIQAFSEADGALNKSRALFTIMGQIWKAGGFSAAFKVIMDEMSWWDWLKTGVIAVAQITAWFATDGVAFIAEAVLTIMSATQLIEDAAKAVKACN